VEDHQPKLFGFYVLKRAPTALSRLEICQYYNFTIDLTTDNSRVAVSTADFLPPRDGADLQLLVNDLYVFSARALDNFPPGCISMSDPQRTWAKVALTDSVKVQPYDPSSQGGATTLVSVDIEVGFAGKKRTETPYDQGELGHAVTSVGFAKDTIADNTNI
jgi:vesicle-fusing ATPase